MNNKDMFLKYGESLRLQTALTDDLAGLVSLTFYVGAGGEELPVLTSVATLTSTEATIFEEEVTIPVGEYKYQYTAIFTDGYVAKYPEINDCSTDLPAFIVTDSLDDVETS